jgi:adenylyltransferase/sulfurtransferase
MNKRRRNNSELSDGSAVAVGEDDNDTFDEDIDMSSIIGCRARSSVPDADSTVGIGRDGLVDLMAEKGEERNGRNAAVMEEDDEDHDDGTVQTRGGAGGNGRDRRGTLSARGGSGGGGERWRFFRWFTRVSRSASSLLSQHSPNLNELLEATVDGPHDAARPPLGGGMPGGPIRKDCDDDDDDCADDDDVQTAFALRDEISTLKERIRALELERDGGYHATGANDRIPRRRDCAVHDGEKTSIADRIGAIPSVLPVRALRPDQISRYSRQLLLSDGFGVEGQRELLSTSVLVIGAGGIGSTVLLYLAAAGVGHVTVVDYDSVEMSNLHRQVVHRDVDASDGTDRRGGGTNKAISARRAMLDLNPTLSCTALAIAVDADNALELASRHDVVVDACDNPRTRYLLNDACILAGKPLVSGSAMGTEGQLTVYNYQSHGAASDGAMKRTACYRCLYPKPVVAEGCKSCNDNGVLGMVPGVVGILQAVEVIKVATGIGSVMHDRLMMYDSLHCAFINVKKPPARSNCAICSSDATIRTMLDSERSLDNVRGPSICALPTPGGTPLSVEQSVSCTEYNEVLSKGQPHVLLDVRVARQYEMCSLKGAINLPLEQLESQLERVGLLSRGELPIYCICRRGIASEAATRIIQQSIKDGNPVHSVYNIRGGLNSWAKTVDLEFPQY